MCIIDQDLHFLMNGFVRVHMQVLFICFVVSTLRPSPAVRRSALTFVERTEKRGRESQRGTGIPAACCILLCNSWFPRPRGGQRGGCQRTSVRRSSRLFNNGQRKRRRRRGGGTSRGRGSVRRQAPLQIFTSELAVRFISVSALDLTAQLSAPL